MYKNPDKAEVFVSSWKFPIKSKQKCFVSQKVRQRDCRWANWEKPKEQGGDTNDTNWRKKKILNSHYTFLGLPSFSQKKSFLHSEMFKEFFQNFQMVLRWVLPLKLSNAGYFSFFLSYFHFLSFYLLARNMYSIVFVSSYKLETILSLAKDHY